MQLRVLQHAEGMKACQLSKFTNYWSHIHDFTKAPNNWSLLPPV